MPWRSPLYAAVATAVFIVWVAFSLGGDTVTKAVDDLGTLAAATAAAVQCFRAGRRGDATTNRFWLLLGAAMTAWAFGEAAWAGYDLLLAEQVPTPSYADVGYLGAIPLAIAALLCHPTNRRRGNVRALLDGSILATGLLVCSRRSFRSSFRSAWLRSARRTARRSIARRSCWPSC